MEDLIARALAAPYGVGIRSARPSALIAALNSALAEAAGRAGLSALAARMGTDPGEVWLAPRALLPSLAVVGSLGPSPSPGSDALTLDDLGPLP
jgi:hypothetical protein